MNALLTNFGTTGDLQPFLALAAEMHRVGHDVTLMFAPRFRSRVESLGFRFCPVGPDVDSAQQRINQAWIAQASLEEVKSHFEPLRDALPQALEDLATACRDKDVLIAGPGMPTARIAHDLTGIPFVSIQVSNFGGIGSRELSDLGRWLVNPLRRKHGLGELAEPLTTDANSPQLALYAVSRHLRGSSCTWPPHYHVTGFLFLDECQWTPDARLRDFLEDREPPVVFTLGSPGENIPPEFLHRLFRAVRRATGYRGVLQIPGGYMDDTEAITIGYVPHAWLFRRSRCVVHHGGSGTAAAVFRAGKPSVFVTMGTVFDQPYWGAMARDLGVAPEPIPFSSLTSTLLAERLSQAIDSAAMTAAAEHLGEQVRSESGVRCARHLIEQLVEKLTVAA